VRNARDPGLHAAEVADVVAVRAVPGEVLATAAFRHRELAN